MKPQRSITNSMDTGETACAFGKEWPEVKENSLKNNF